MKCILCEQEGTYRLLIQNKNWKKPLDVDGMYCANDVNVTMDGIKKQIQAPAPDFSVVNTPKPPVTPLPITPDNVEETEPEVDKEEEPDTEDYSKYVIIKKSNPYAAEEEIINERRALVKAMWEQGWRNTYKLAERIGSTRGAVYQDLRALGIKRKKGWPK